MSDIREGLGYGRYRDEPTRSTGDPVPPVTVDRSPARPEDVIREGEAERERDEWRGVFKMRPGATPQWAAAHLAELANLASLGDVAEARLRQTEQALRELLQVAEAEMSQHVPGTPRRTAIAEGILRARAALDAQPAEDETFIEQAARGWREAKERTRDAQPAEEKHDND